MENRHLIDYITLTIKFSPSFDGYYKICEYINHLQKITNNQIMAKSFIRTPYGRNHFNVLCQYCEGNEFTICASDSNPKMADRICMTITGLGCRMLGGEVVDLILQDAADYEPHCTRLDLAYDDYNGSFPVVKIIKAFKGFVSGKKFVESRYKQSNAGLYSGVYDGISYSNLAFGKRGGSQYLRLYDKRAEQGQKGQECEYSYWYRFEQELRGECSQNAYMRYVAGDSLGVIWTEYINRMFRVLKAPPKNVHQEKKKQEIPTAQWWLDFLGTSQKAKVIWDKPDTQDATLYSIKKHVEQYAADIYILMRQYPVEFDRIVQDIGARKAQAPKYHRVYKEPLKYDAVTRPVSRFEEISRVRPEYRQEALDALLQRLNDNNVDFYEV